MTCRISRRRTCCESRSAVDCYIGEEQIRRRSIERIRFASADRLSDICEEALLPEKNCEVQIVYQESAKYLLPERIVITDRLDRMSIREELLPERKN